MAIGVSPVASPVSRERYRHYVEGDPERAPESVDAARDEDRELVLAMQGIEAQLGQAAYEGGFDPGWRRQAVDARRHMNARRSFLKDWIGRQGAIQRALTRPADLDEVYTTTLLRVAAKRTGALESVFVASVHMLANETDETRAEWRRRVTQAMDAIKTPMMGGE